MASSICDLSKPIASIFAICSARSEPIEIPDVAADGAPGPAGLGVAGTSLDDAGAEARTGDGGGIGVEATGCAGVDGAFGAAAGAGAAFGFKKLVYH